MSKIPVAVLGATGAVGQRFVQLLDNHPWFQVVALTASGRSSGKTFAQSCRWLLSSPMPEWASKLTLLPTQLAGLDTPIVFSALPSGAARDIEADCAKAGMVVCSNASTYRAEVDVPIVLPEVNPDHLKILNVQRDHRNWKGAILTNPNCTSTGMTVALKAIQETFGLKRVFVVSLQALSGAGYPGIPSLDVVDNILPFIEGEEEKLEFEPRKILGSLNGSDIHLAKFLISAHANRVPVSDGHTVCMSIECEQKVDIAAVKQAFMHYQPPEICQRLPSTPKPVIYLMQEDDRPQPRLDRNLGKGMATVIGRVRNDPLFDVRFVVLSHNTIRGAAGGSIYNAELVVESNLLG